MSVQFIIRLLFHCTKMGCKIKNGIYYFNNLNINNLIIMIIENNSNVINYCNVIYNFVNKLQEMKNNVFYCLYPFFFICFLSSSTSLSLLELG